MPENIDTRQLSGDVLPTVYISNISLRSGGLSKNTSKPRAKRRRQQKNFSGQALSVDILMYIKEVLSPEQTSSWLLNGAFTKFLKIKVIQSSDMMLTKELAKGNFRALNQKKFKNVYAEKVIPVLKGDLKRTPGYTLESDLNKYSSVVINSENRVYNVPYETKFVVPKSQPLHLSYFAFVYVDLAGLAKEYGLSFRRLGLNKKFVKGVIQSERVIVEGEVNTTSYIFYVEKTGEVWTGPKHKNSRDQWLTGRKGVRNASLLRRQEVVNLKINDYRESEKAKKQDIIIRAALKKFQNLQKKQLNLDQPPPFFTESYISRGVVSPKPNGQVDLLFHVDIEKLVRTQSAFGSIIDDMQNPRSKREIYLLSNIKNIRVLRRRVTKARSFNRLGSSIRSGMFDGASDIVATIVYSADDKLNNSLERKDQSLGSIREISAISFAENVRTFTVTDKDVTDITDGFYQYGVSIEVEDGTIKFLNKQLRKLNNIRKMMQNYHNDATNPRYLTSEGTFEAIFAKKYKKLARKRKTIAPWTKAIAVYLDALTSFTTLTIRPRKFSRKIYSMVNAKTGSASGISAFIEMIDELIRIVDTTLGNKKTPDMSSPFLPARRSAPATVLGAPVGGSRSKTKGGFKISVMTIDRWFKDLHDSNILRNVGVDVLGHSGRQSIGVKSITVQDFFQRIGAENSMYWNSDDLTAVSANLEGATSRGGSRVTNNAEGLFNLETNKLSFLSPAKINGGSYTIDRLGQGKDAWDSDKFNAMASNLSAVQSGYYNNVAVVGNSTDRASRRNTEDSKKNNVRNNVHDNSVSSVLAQLGVTILDSLEEESLETIETAGVDDLPANQVFNTNNQITTVSEAEADTQDQTIARRKQRRVETIYRENMKAVGNIFVNMVAANGEMDKNLRVKKSPTTDIPGADIQSYNLKSVNNMVDTVATAKGGTTIAAIPNQVKSLMFSNTPETPTDFLNAPVDMLKNPETAQMMRANFDTLSRVEVFVGFEQDSTRDNIIDKPKYELLQSKHIEFADSRVLLCRIKKYENKTLNIGQNKGLNLQIYDNCFLMSATELDLLLTKKRQLSARVVTINQSALAKFAALEESVTAGLAAREAAEQAAIAEALALEAMEAARLAAEEAAAKELEEMRLADLEAAAAEEAAIAAAELEAKREERKAKKTEARRLFGGGGQGMVFDFLYDWIAANSDLRQRHILDFLADVDLTDKDSILKWLISNTSAARPEVREFLVLLSTMLFEEIIIEDVDNIDRDTMDDFTRKQKKFLMEWLNTRGGLSFSDIDEIFSRITNFQKRSNVKRVLKARTDISIGDINDALDILYEEQVPEITPYEKAILDTAAAKLVPANFQNITSTQTVAAGLSAATVGALGEFQNTKINADGSSDVTTTITTGTQSVSSGIVGSFAGSTPVLILDQDEPDEIMTMMVDLAAMDQFGGTGDEQSSGETQDDAGEKDITNSAVFKAVKKKKKRKNKNKKNASSQDSKASTPGIEVEGNTWAVVLTEDPVVEEDVPEEDPVLQLFGSSVGVKLF